MLETSARLLRLLSLLQAPRVWPGAELAGRLGSARARCATTSSACAGSATPWRRAAGAAGGYRLGAGAAMPPLLLDDDEAVAVVVGLRAAAGRAVAGLDEAAPRALAKLTQVLPPRLRGRARALSAATVPLPEWAPPVVAPETLTALAGGHRPARGAALHLPRPGGPGDPAPRGAPPPRRPRAALVPGGLRRRAPGLAHLPRRPHRRPQPDGAPRPRRAPGRRGRRRPGRPLRPPPGADVPRRWRRCTPRRKRSPGAWATPPGGWSPSTAGAAFCAAAPTPWSGSPSGWPPWAASSRCTRRPSWSPTCAPSPAGSRAPPQARRPSRAAVPGGTGWRRGGRTPGDRRRAGPGPPSPGSARPRSNSVQWAIGPACSIRLRTEVVRAEHRHRQRGASGLARARPRPPRPAPGPRPSPGSACIPSKVACADEAPEPVSQ